MPIRYCFLKRILPFFAIPYLFFNIKHVKAASAISASEIGSTFCAYGYLAYFGAFVLLSIFCLLAIRYAKNTKPALAWIIVPVATAAIAYLEKFTSAVQCSF